MNYSTATGLKIVLFVSALAVGAAPPPGGFTFDQVLQRHDANGDGVVTQSEFSGAKQFFSRLDSDQDKTITRAEFEAFMKSRADRNKESFKGGNPAGGRRQTGQAPRSGQKTPGLTDVTVHRDLEYAVAEGESLALDLYLPKKPTSAPPLVVWIHGGGWRNGDKAQVNRAILQLSEEGYAVASINYRLEDLYIHPKQIHDCKGAVRWLRAHAGKYGYDATRIAVGGGSAGGHLALLLGLSGGVADLEGTVGGNPDLAGAVQAIIDLYGPAGLPELAKNSARFNRAHKFDAQQLIHASPLTYLSADDPPVLIIHGDQDKTVPVEQSKLLHERYQKSGLSSELHIIEGVGHGGSVFSNKERSAVIKAFLDKHIGTTEKLF